MYKLLIVDDEPLSQVGLKSMVDWPSLDVEIVGAAPNGLAALELIGRLKPDIVIADLRMPLLDGLGLVERCRAEPEGGPAFIVVTGYADFDSLRRAMRGSVVDYLVKLELDEEALRASVEKAKAAVRDRRKLGLSSPAGAGSADPFAETALTRLLAGSYADAEEARASLERSGLSLGPGGFRVALFKVEYANAERLSEEERLRAYCCAVDMVKQVAGREASTLVLPFDVFSFAAILTLDGAGEHSAVDILERAREVIVKFFGVSLRAGLGSERREPLRAADSYREAACALGAAGGDAPGERRIVAYEDLRDRQSDAGVAARFESAEIRGRNPLVSGVRRHVLENYGSKLSLSEVAKRFEVSPNHLSTLFKKCTGIGFSEFVAQVKVDKAKELMAEGRYKMFEIAQLLGFEDAFYFSKVFKRIAGQSPRDYCTGRSERE